MLFDEFKKPFEKTDIEWRIGRGGLKQDGTPWAMVLAYLTNRAIMDRLDQVCGAEGWQNQYMTAPCGGVLCGISVYIPERDTWITKWDGAENTDVESVKGGLSASMKRAAVHWGMGRYLYKLENSFATIVDKGTPGALQGRVKDKSKKDHYFYYLPPELPSWALPTMLYTDSQIKAHSSEWQARFKDGTSTPEEIIKMIQTRYKLSESQITSIKALSPKEVAA